MLERSNTVTVCPERLLSSLLGEIQNIVGQSQETSFSNCAEQGDLN